MQIDERRQRMQNKQESSTLYMNKTKVLHNNSLSP